ncbi:ABC transporter permease [Lederbergia sp. NSJ-179]|uniref:ABC transporter permease n=1 Tax=Lederbergia sp. NSJ-179 TaxID=2931402 RepID=UPI001FD3B950|nr:ABC transporter permease subunit [Lederbergia sp. NSJ-179]MCJ7842120.1 ABC transporter permease [Lederbergia sp. NSJ-179]
MFHVLKREFIDSFKSVRSILIILFITFVSYQSATFFDSNPGIVSNLMEDGEESSIYTASIALIVSIFGFLFVFATSHDLINKEVELKTIRLLVTKVSRGNIMTGKLLGTMLFWVVTVSISFVVLTVIAGSWFPKDYFQTLVFLFYIINSVLLISTLVTKPKLTMFLGVILGLALPIIGLVSMLSDKWYLVPFKYLLPYRYMEGSIVLMLIPLAIGVIYFLISVLIMKRKDL